MAASHRGKPWSFKVPFKGPVGFRAQGLGFKVPFKGSYWGLGFRVPFAEGLLRVSF